MELNNKEILKRDRRSTNLAKNSIKFVSEFALQSISIPLFASNPLLGLTGGFIIGTLLEVLWPSNFNDAIRAHFLQEINTVMVQHEVRKMQMRLRNYKQLIRNLFGFFRLPRRYLNEWQNSVSANGIDFESQKDILQKYKKQMSQSSFAYFKKRLLALNTYIEIDRERFYNPSDPSSSLAYYREFATMELNLLAAEIILESGERQNDQHILNNLRTRLKSAAKKHYRFVLWAAHKAATKIQTKTQNWIKYNEAVNSILTELPIQEWKQIALINDDGIHNIQNIEAVSLKFLTPAFFTFRFVDNYWLSCYVSGSKCKFRTCPGIDNPFEAGNQYEYHYKCRGEVFWIFGDGRSGSYIRDCDKVALQYSFSNDKNKGYWLSLDRDWWAGNFYNTRTCPGRNFFNSNLYTCRNEIFILDIQGKNCGDILQDRDVITLRDRNGNYVGAILNPLRDYDLVSRANSVSKWRIYKQNSLIKKLPLDIN